MSLYIGLMSGTSMDGIDAVLARLDRPFPEVVATHGHPMPAEMRAELLALSSAVQVDLDRLGGLDVRLGRLFAEAALALIAKARRQPAEIRALGSHGQTLRHCPAGRTPYTLQIGDPNVIAEYTRITTVADFRRRDLAAGGQGAPLVPAFHQAVFTHPDTDRVVVNIGGMANITLLPAGGQSPAGGFDTGPGNVLLDGWASVHRGVPLDEDGRWASGGTVHAGLLAHLLADPYFSRPPPKSTGREYFHRSWLEARLSCWDPPPSPQDVQRTLCALTSMSIGSAIRQYAPEAKEVLICGGGVHNPVLLAGLADHLPGCRVASTAACGLDPDWVEATAFAWLARRTLAGLPGNLPAVTGARHPVVLGGIYPHGSQGQTAPAP